MELSIGKRGEITACISGDYSTVLEIQDAVSNGLLTQGIFPTLESLPSFYLLYNGKLLNEDNEVVKVTSLEKSIVSVVPRLLGGKGGFGSMLRAIGAQIEKTTNRDACRDLSGRRLRDINEEARLKKWYARQKEREEARQEAKKQKLERLRNFADGPALPKIDDQEFLQKREDVQESVFAAVDEAFSEIPEMADSEIRSNSSPSSSGDNSCEKFPNFFAEMSETAGSSISIEKADQTTAKKKPQKRAVKTMFDEDFGSDSSADSSSDEDEVPVKAKKAKLTT